MKWSLCFVINQVVTAFSVTAASQHSLSEAVSRYHPSTPYVVVSKNNWNTELVHDACIVHTVIGEKVRLRTKQ